MHSGILLYMVQPKGGVRIMADKVKKKGTHRPKSFWAAILVLSLLAFLSLAPLVLVLINSIKTHSEILKNPLSLPQKIHFENFSYEHQIKGKINTH